MKIEDKREITFTLNGEEFEALLALLATATFEGIEKEGIAITIHNELWKYQ